MSMRADHALGLFDEAMGLVEQARATDSEELPEEAERHAWRIVREAEPVRLSYVSAVGRGRPNQSVTG